MPEDSVPAQVAASFQRLAATASKLNGVSDELAESITALDAALKVLNLGVPAWVKVAGDADGDTEQFWLEELGYARVNGQWGIALRSREGWLGDPDNEHVEKWLFNDAPRALRVEAVDHMPALLDEMAKQADSIAEKIKGKLGQTQQLLALVTANAQRPDKPRRK